VTGVGQDRNYAVARDVTAESRGRTAESCRGALLQRGMEPWTIDRGSRTLQQRWTGRDRWTAADPRHQNEPTTSHAITAAMTSANRAAALTIACWPLARRQPLIPKSRCQSLVCRGGFVARTIGEAIDLESSRSDELCAALRSHHWRARCSTRHQARDAMLDGAVIIRLRMSANGGAPIRPRLRPAIMHRRRPTPGIGMSSGVAARAFDRSLPPSDRRARTRAS